VNSPWRKNVARKLKRSEKCQVCRVRTEVRQERFAAQPFGIFESRGDGLAQNGFAGASFVGAYPNTYSTTAGGETVTAVSAQSVSLLENVSSGSVLLATFTQGTDTRGRRRLHCNRRLGRQRASRSDPSVKDRGRCRDA
jgi:hypothetical protein